jgi:hypothetical protein
MRKDCLFAFAVVACVLVAGCGPSVEERKAMQAFNDLEVMIEHGGYVKKFDKFENNDEKVFEIEAEILDANDVPIGRLRSERVEGFGTMRPRIQWYKTPGVREEWVQQPRRRGQGRGPRGEGGERRERPGGPPREGSGPPPGSGTSENRPPQ